MNELKKECETFARYHVDGKDMAMYEWGTRYNSLDECRCEKLIKYAQHLQDCRSRYGYIKNGKTTFEKCSCGLSEIVKDQEVQSESITDEQMSILKHTETNNTGYFCGDSPDMQRLVELKLMESAGRKSFVPDEYFRLTSNWRIVLEDLKKAAKDKKFCSICGVDNRDVHLTNCPKNLEYL